MSNSSSTTTIIGGGINFSAMTRAELQSFVINLDPTAPAARAQTVLAMIADGVLRDAEPRGAAAVEALYG